MKEKLEFFKNYLKEKGLRVTQNRIAVFSILEKNENSFLSPDEIFEKVKKSKNFQCDRVSVYRALSSFEEIGIVNTSHFQGEAVKYQIHFHPKHEEDNCHDCHSDHQHYFKCKSCTKVFPIGDCLFDDKLKELEKLGFKCEGHHFEVLGICPDCH